MKVGDKVQWKNHPNVFTVISFKLENVYDDFKRKSIIKTAYTARCDATGALIKFYGYDVNKRIFKVEDDSSEKQLSFFDMID